MTSETTEKQPIIITPFGRNPKRRDYSTYSGIIVIILTWIYLYFSCIGTLYDGISSFLWSSDRIHVLSGVVTEIAITVATSVVGVSGAPVEIGTGKFYALCGLSGILSCGITHTAIVPLDLVKCRIQVNPQKYKGIVGGFRTTLAEEGVRGLGKGWAPTAIGYSLQGLGKFGFYELFKVVYADMLGEVTLYFY